MSDDAMDVVTEEEKVQVGERLTGAQEEPQMLTQALSQTVYEVLKKEMPENKWEEMLGSKARDLKIVESDARENRKVYRGVLYEAISEAYDKLGRDLLKAATDAAVAKLEEILAADLAPDSSNSSDFQLIERLASAFQAPYAGDAHINFGNYLCQCWGLCKDNEHIFPYVAVTQSSGFGKSRMLYEFAKSCAKRCRAWHIVGSDSGAQRVEMNAQPSEVEIRVLYVCARDNKRSTGFPVVTPKLNTWFFDNPDEMETRLLAALEYAEANWDGVGKQWLRLFDDPAADEDVYKDLNPPSGETDASRPDDNPRQSKQARVASDSTPNRTREQAELEQCKSRGSSGGEVAKFANMTIAASTSSKSSSSSKGEGASSSGRLLVLVVDEARLLLEKKKDNRKKKDSYFQLFRRVLRTANGELKRMRGGTRGIFGVFVDTSSRVHDFVPPAKRDPSSREPTNEASTLLFAPFVLTHTMNVLRDSAYLKKDGSYNYRESVKNNDPSTAWNTLVSMGRPLWKSCLVKIDNVDHQQTTALALAASKLLCSAPVTHVASYGKSGLGGVAALLCRLGLRPRAYSGLSSQMVADFMAVLGYVTFAYDAHISSYPSEPVLAFGAARLWYELEGRALTTYMLPQFKELLRQGMIDTGNIGEIAARIILLLAMDEAIINAFPEYGEKKATFRFVGQFCSVKQFLHQLAGVTPELHNTVDKKVTDKEKTAFGAWMDKWKGWKIGFSQFVELRKAPTDKTLWFLLGRRAAAVLPRNQAGADLLIPIFRDDAVSFVLIQVKNMYSADQFFPDAATSKLTPSKVFGTKGPKPKVPKPPHPFTTKSPVDMIRIYMTLRECFEAPKPFAREEAPSPRVAAAQPSSPPMRTRSQSKTKGGSTESKEALTSEKKQRYRGPRYFLIDKSNSPEVSYSLVLRGMCRTPKQSPELAKLKPDLWPFLKLAFAELEEIANAAWWDPMNLVRNDLSKRAKAKYVNSSPTVHIMLDDYLEDVARRTLAHRDAEELTGEESADET